MPTKRKFTARFPTTRIKKIMQLDEEIGKLAATVPPVVSRALELFMEELVTQAYELTSNKNSRTISPSCIKHVIEHNDNFAFLRNLVSDIPEFKPQSKPSAHSDSLRHAPLISRSPHSDSEDIDDPRQLTRSTQSPTKSRKRKSVPRKKLKVSENSGHSDGECSLNHLQMDPSDRTCKRNASRKRGSGAKQVRKNMNGSNSSRPIPSDSDDSAGYL